MTTTVRGQKGNVLLQVLVTAAVLGLTFYFLTNYVIGQRKQVGMTVNAVNLRFALNSTMDYVLFGIRQKYCFTDDNLLMNAPLSSCNLSHTGSIERLIMSNDQENFIRQLAASGKNIGQDPNKLRLKSFTRYLAVDSVTTEHPLFPVLRMLKMVKDLQGRIVKVGWIQVYIERDDSPYLPRAGREVYLKAVISLKAEKNDANPLQVGSIPLEISSKIAIFPREVGSFALLVPGNLYLDRPAGASVNQGDVVLHSFGSRSEAGTSTGLVFLSPVFVNGDIHIPADSSSGDLNRVPYSAVTFADRVYMGNGAVKAGGGDFRPKTAGVTTDRYWPDVRTFGGFLKGLENDGARDAGLEVVGKIRSGSRVDVDLMSRCVDWNLAQSSKDSLYRSKVGVALRTADPNVFQYRLYLSDRNQFSKQKNKLQNIEYQNWGTGTASRNASDDNNAILKIKFQMGDRAVAGQLPNDSSLTVKPQVDFPALKARYENDVASATANLAGAETALAGLKSELNDKRNSLSSLESELSEEKNKPAPPNPLPSPFDPSGYRDAGKISNLENRISSVKSEISSLVNNKIPNQERVVSTAKTQLDNAERVLANYRYIQNNPPEMTIKVVPVDLAWGGKSKDKVVIQVYVKNASSFIDSSGNLVAPSVGFQAYDSTYQNSNSIFTIPNQNLTGFMNFSFNYNKTAFDVPQYLSKGNDSNSGKLDSDYGAVDYDKLEYDCERARNALISQAFGGADWTVSFAATARSSWNFAGDSSSTVGTDPMLSSIEFNGSNSNFAAKNITFRVHSIVGRCVIKATANFVTGFYTCDNLIIEPRTTPLRIIGTFIASKAYIDPSAIRAGIQWSSIYYPQATRELREAKVLESMSGRDCDTPKSPIWHPIPSIQDVADRMKCNAISLRSKADPFQWTSVDPDCGIVSGSSSNTTCKRRLIRFFVVEQSREGAI
ncbi:hypothetical protein [Bdellovibrio sp. HCB2-146]|uniref:hypothetical protein n=1 Tax=Bdellovibrio sp. HCB2-146 TaxID=3394362 RepID=UPI0039BD10B1